MKKLAGLAVAVVLAGVAVTGCEPAMKISPDSAEPEAAGRAALKPLRRDGKVVRRRRSGRAYEYRLMSPQAALEVPSEELFNAPDDDESPA